MDLGLGKVIFLYPNPNMRWVLFLNSNPIHERNYPNPCGLVGWVPTDKQVDG